MFVEIKDSRGNHIGELNASNDEILKYLNKGYMVINKSTSEEMTKEDVMDTIGCSDGFIDINA